MQNKNKLRKTLPKRRVKKIIKKENQIEQKIDSLTSNLGKVKLADGLMTRSTRVSRRNLMTALQSYQISYARSIVLPEFSRGAKLPSIFPQPTASMHKHITVPINVSANGKAAIVWQPYVLQDTAATPFSGLYVNNSANLTLTTAEAVTGYTVVATPWGVPANVYSSYRLVSASIRIDPQMSLQNAQGTIAGGIAVYANQAGFHQTSASGGPNVFLFAGDLTVASNVDNLLYFNKANITEQQSIRHIFFPLDPTYEFYTPMNQSHGFSANATENNTDFYFGYYITGAPASSSFNIELYMNFECIPTPTAEGYLPVNPYIGNEDSSKIIKSATAKPGVITQASSNLGEVLLDEDSDFQRVRSTGKQGSFINDIGAFINDHGVGIMKLVKTIGSMFL